MDGRCWFTREISRETGAPGIVISVLILTLNEEANLPDCLASVQWSDDVLVLDAGSTDRTVEIAQKAGARVFVRAVTDERSQRAYSLTLPFKYPWVYNPDADEITTPELRSEMQSVVASNPPEVAFRVRFKNYFQDRWIKHSSLYPTWVVRLFRPQNISFERATNLRYIVKGREGRLNEHFLHYSFRRGILPWIQKHTVYADGEARESLNANQAERGWLRLFSIDAVRRRSAWKRLSMRMPLRPVARFVYMYFLRMGFLDGRPGLIYCALLSFYEWMIVLRLHELKQQSARRH